MWNIFEWRIYFICLILFLNEEYICLILFLNEEYICLNILIFYFFFAAGGWSECGWILAWRVEGHRHVWYLSFIHMIFVIYSPVIFHLFTCYLSVEGGTVRVVGEHNEKDKVTLNKYSSDYLQICQWLLVTHSLSNKYKTIGVIREYQLCSMNL